MPFGSFGSFDNWLAHVIEVTDAAQAKSQSPGTAQKGEALNMAIAAALPPEVQKYLALKRHKEAFALSRSFPDFHRASWPIIEPSTPYLTNWHIDCLGEYLLAVRMGQITRLLVNMPPRMAKSITITIDFPCWWWTDDPSERFMFASYDNALVKEHSIKRRAIIESDWYQQRWGLTSLMPEHKRITLADDQNEKREFWNTVGGTMTAVPIGGGATGKGGNVIIIDDPQNPDQADSPTERLHAIRFIEGTLMTRLNNQLTGRIVGVMQRLHEKDWTGHELSKGGWVHLCLPAKADRRTIIQMPVSGRTIIREAGENLWEERLPDKAQQNLKRSMSEQRYAGQYQQRPAPAEGNLIKRAWLSYRWGGATGVPLPTEFDFVVDSWDFAVKEQSATEKKSMKAPDFNAGGKWGIKGSRFYLLRVPYHKRADFPEALEACRSLAKSEPYPNAVLIEDKANGSPIIQTLRSEITGITPYNPGTRDKVARASAASPALKAGSVILPHESMLNDEERQILAEYIEELCVFNNGENDDCVDMTVQLINWHVESGGGWLAWVNQVAAEEEAARQNNARPDGETIINDGEKKPHDDATKPFTFADVLH